MSKQFEMPTKTKKPDELDLLFSEKDPFAPKKPRLKESKQKASTVDQLNTWYLLRELYKRHHVTIYTVGFWVELAIIIYIRLGK